MGKFENKTEHLTVRDEEEFRGRRRRHVRVRGRAASLSLTIDGRRGRDLHAKETGHAAPAKT